MGNVQKCSMLKHVIPNARSEDKINVGMEGVNWINLAQERDKYRL